MDRKKSLGSSPIGFSSLDSNSYGFIRDLGVSSSSSSSSSSASSIRNETPRESNYPESYTGKVSTVNYEKDGSDSNDRPPAKEHDDNRNTLGDGDKKRKDEQSEKKIVSYYLEIELIRRLKNLADAEGSYYSAVVSRAIEAWVEHKGY